MIFGDPHIVTFDLMNMVKRDFHRERSRSRGGPTHWRLGKHVVPDVFRQGTYWVVKSEQVLIQGRYSSGSSAWNMRGLAFGGKFLRNHRLSIDHLADGRGLVSWDGRRVSAKPRFRNWLAEVRTKYDGNGFKEAEITLPAGVKVSLLRKTWGRNRANVQAIITMPAQTGGQDGHCGQADGTFPEDKKGYLLQRWGAQVPRSQQLFATRFSLLGSLLEGAEGRPSTAERCAEQPPEPLAEELCGAALNGTATALADVLRPGCLVDVCATGAEAAEATAEAARQAALVLREGWYDGGEGKSCDEGCQAQGLVCSEEELLAHNHEVDSTEEMLTLVEQLGGETWVQDCDETWGTADDVPNWSLGVCHRSSSARALSTFSCSARPRGGFHAKHRLCYCHNP